MEGHVGLDVEKSRSGNITVVGLTSGMAADVSSMVWEGDVLEAGDLSDHAGGALSFFVERTRLCILLSFMSTPLLTVDGVYVHDMSPMKVHRLLSGPPGSQVVSTFPAVSRSMVSSPPSALYPNTSVSDPRHLHRQPAPQPAADPHRPPPAPRLTAHRRRFQQTDIFG